MFTGRISRWIPASVFAVLAAVMVPLTQYLSPARAALTWVVLVLSLMSAVRWGRNGGPSRD